MLVNIEPNEDAKASDRSPSALITLSHELRTPLHGVLGLIEMLRGEDLSPTATRIVDRLNTTADSLMQIFNSAVEAQRIREDKVVLASRRYSLLDVVETAISIYAYDIEAKGVEFSLQFDPRLIGREFVGDPERQLEVLAALLSNASKFTASGSVKLIVALRKEKVSTTQVMIRVVDTGIGIAPDQLSKICELGYQIESKERGRPSGTGLGLYLAKNLLALQNSRLEYLSNSDGSLFHYTQDLTASPEPETGWRAVGNNSRVTIIAPVSVQVELMKLCLETLGVEVDYHQTLESADAQQRSNLTLIDYRLAAQNLVAFKQMRESYAAESLVVLTTDFEPATALLTRGVTSWYAPYLPSELLRLAQSAGAIESYQRDSLSASTITQAERQLPSDLSKYTLLCVDDSPTNLIVLIGALTKLGFKRIVRATDGLEAVDACKAHPEINLVLMDFHMPRLNGAQAARQIKSMGVEVPIIGITALSEADLASQVGDGDFIEVLTKPASIGTLSRCLAQHLPEKI